MSILARKSWQDIRRRRARSLFTITTIAAAVASLGLFALPSLMDRAMTEEIARSQLHDIRIRIQDLQLSGADREAILALPGVEAIELRTAYPTEVRFGDRREDALLVGVEDFDAQAVNVVDVGAGTTPAGMEALTDPQNAQSGRLHVKAGDRVEVEDNLKERHALTISGSGRTLEFSQLAGTEAVVLYAPQATVNAIAGSKGVNSVELRVTDPEEAQAVAAAVRDWLVENHPEVAFTELPDVREAGTWPGQEIFNNFGTLFYVGAVLALISAVALISNTMTTMVAEQRREIAILKAIGGRPRQVALSFLRTAGLLAVTGAVAGVILGIPFANFLVRLIGNEFYGVTPGWGISWPVVVISLVAGTIGTMAAALPSVWRATRITVREGVAPSAAGGGGTMTRALQRIPLPPAARIGLRSVTRRKTRALATIVQVGLAAGIGLGFLALGVTVSRLTADTWDTLSWDVIVIQKANVPLDREAAELIEGLDGAAITQPVLYNNLDVDGVAFEAWGMGQDTRLYEPDLAAGRWLEPGDGAAKAKVAVIGRALAARQGLGVGDTLHTVSARGGLDLTVIGIDRRLVNNADSIFLPIETLQEALVRDDTNAYWLVSSSQDEAAIDRLAAEAEDRLAAAGYPVRTESHYVEKEANLASNRTLVRVLAAMGIPIVAIGLIGLVNMMTMNVIERTREVGILRCIGASGKDVTRIFRSEALVIAALGWALAVPAGWLVGKALVEIIAALFDFGSVPYSFPAWYPPLALVATLGLAWVIVIPPLRRASRLRPGDALRYE